MPATKKSQKSTKEKKHNTKQKVEKKEIVNSNSVKNSQASSNVSDTNNAESNYEIASYLSIVLGATSLLGVCIGGACCIPFSMLAMGTGFYAYTATKTKKTKDMSMIGMIIAGVAILVSIILFILNFAVLTSVFSLMAIEESL